MSDTPTSAYADPPNRDPRCTCPWDVRSLGRLHGINMGKGTVRLSTTPGCPDHDACKGYTAEVRRNRPGWSNPWCPIHQARPCAPGVRGE